MLKGGVFDRADAVPGVSPCKNTTTGLVSECPVPRDYAAQSYRRRQRGLCRTWQTVVSYQW